MSALERRSHATDATWTAGTRKNDDGQLMATVAARLDAAAVVA
jgi:hypothetical protein